MTARSGKRRVTADSTPEGLERRARVEALNADIGRRIRERRTLAGLTQASLAHRLGVSYQQVQKYETGANRVSSAMLVLISDAIGCPPMDLLPGPDDALTQVDQHGGTSRGIIQAVTDLKALDPATRNAIAAVIHAVARAQEDYTPAKDVA